MNKIQRKVCSILIVLAMVFNIIIPSTVSAHTVIKEATSEVENPKYQIHLTRTWTDFDKIYLREDQDSICVSLKWFKEELLDLNDENSATIKKVDPSQNPFGDEYVAILKKGLNKITIKDWVEGDFVPVDRYIQVEEMDYKIDGTVAPGETVTLKLEGLGAQLTDGKTNPLQESQTIYNTDIPGVSKIQSEKELGQNPDEEVLSNITFTIPQDTEAGEYNLKPGRVYHKFGGISINGGFTKDFSILPEIILNVDEDGANGEDEDVVPQPEDTQAPTIITDLVDKTEVNESSITFTARVSDNKDDKPKLLVKLEDEVISTDRPSRYEVQLFEGENVITLEASDKSGNKKIEQYTIICSPILKPGASIALDSEYLKLEVGDKHQIIAAEAPDSRSSEDEPTARMTYEVVDGEDVVKINKYGKVEALKVGSAKINVAYPGLTQPGVIVVNVVEDKESDTPKITTNIDETKYDIFYYTDDSEYTFEVESSDAKTIEVKVNDTKISDSQGTYSVDLEEGNNIIHIKAIDGNKVNETYYNIKAKPVTITVKNATNEGKEIVKGDTVRVEFEGLQTPVAKFLRVYNPKNTRVAYDVNMPGMSNIFGQGTQYNIATDNAIEFVATKAGTFNFTNGHIDEYWWGDDLFKERDISGEGPNTGAPVKHDKFSSIPGFTIKVNENSEYQDKYVATINNKDNLKPGSEVVLKINNLEMPGDSKDKIMTAKTIYNSDIKGLEVIESKEAKDDKELLKEIRFTLPKDLSPGTYTITNGRVFKEWIGSSPLSKEKEFYKGELPEIKIVVKEGEAVDPEVPQENTKPVITAANLQINIGDKFDPLSNITATDKEDGDLTASIKVIENTVNTKVAGEYKVVYKVVDSKGLETTKQITVVVRKVPTPDSKNLKVGIYTDEKALYESIDVEYKEGDTPYTVLKRLLGDKVVTTGQNESLYVEGIDDLYEFDKGSESGWVYAVNRDKPSVSAGIFDVNPGDEIIWHYTLDLGSDIERSYYKFDEFLEDKGQVPPPVVNSAPVISANDIEVTVGEVFNPMTGVTATDKEDGNLTNAIKIVENTVDTSKEGTYKVVYEVADSEGLKANKEIKVVVKQDKQDEVLDVEVLETIKSTSKWVLDNLENPGFEDEWKLLGLKRGNVEVPKDYYKTYYNNLAKLLKEKDGDLHRSKYTEYSRVIIALTALGYDPTDVAGYNIVEKLYNLDNVSKQGINGVIFALIALDTKGFEIKGDKNSRDMMIDYIMDRQLSDGGFALSGDTSEVDITAMAIQALAKYKDREDVKSAIDKAINFLSSVQLSTGGYGAYEGENPESSAQVLVAINTLGISANDERFVKNKNTIVDAIENFEVEGGGFKHLSSQDKVDSMATEQVLYALVSQERLNNKETSLYDMSDVKIEDTDDTVINPEEDEDDEDKDEDDKDETNNQTGNDSNSGSNSNDNDDDNENSDNPQTSDNTIMPLVMIALASVAGIAILNRKKLK